MSTPASSASRAASARLPATPWAMQLLDRPPVAEQHAVEAPFVAQQAAQQRRVAGGRHPAERVERGHVAGGAGVRGGLERRQVSLAQGALGHVGDVVVAPALGRAVGAEVLGRRP